MFAKYFTPHIGGVERHVSSVASVLCKKGASVTVITEKYDENLSDDEFLGKVMVLRFDYPKIKFAGLLLIWFKLFSHYLDEIKRADIVHIHDVFIWYLPFRFLFPNKPVYVTFHGYPSFPLSRKAIFYQKMAEKLTGGNICVGSFIEKWFGTRPSFVTYGGVDFKKFHPVTNEEMIYDAVYLGRLDDQSCFLKYLDAFKILLKKKLRFKLLVLGDGKYKSKIKESKNLVYKGAVEDPFHFIQKSRFAFVSGYLSILEALACKKLVFAMFDDPLKEDYLKMTPFYKSIVVCNSSSELARYVEFYTLNPNEAEKKIEPGYKWVKKQTWDKLADTYLTLWKT